MSILAAKRIILLTAVALYTIGSASAQDFPSKPITWVVPSSAGGGTTAVAQVIVPAMEKELGQTIVIDYRPGGGTVVGTQSVAKAPADGYTLLQTTTSFAINNALIAKLPYRVPEDFTPITLLVDAPLALIVNANAGVDSVKALAEKAKMAPGTVTYGSVGIGSSHQLLAAHFANSAGAEMRHIPYQGGSQLAAAVASGEVTFSFIDVGAVQELVAGGLVKSLALSAPARLASLPDLPTMEEAGFPGFNRTTWQGLVAPKGLPDDVLARLSEAITKVLKTESVAKALSNTGKPPRLMTPEGYQEFLVTDIRNWKDYAAAAGITPK